MMYAQQYKASITVPDCYGPERILTINSDLDIIMTIMGEMAPKLEDMAPKNGNENEIDLRMLVHQSQAGSVIGKGGSKIKELREKTGARIKIYSNCCPHSTDRLISVAGKSDTVLDCIRELITTIKSSPMKGVNNPYDPRNCDEFYAEEYGGYSENGQSAGSGGGKNFGNRGSGASGGGMNRGGGRDIRGSGINRGGPELNRGVGGFPGGMSGGRLGPGNMGPGGRGGLVGSIGGDRAYGGPGVGGSRGGMGGGGGGGGGNFGGGRDGGFNSNRGGPGNFSGGASGGRFSGNGWGSGNSNGIGGGNGNMGMGNQCPIGGNNQGGGNQGGPGSTSTQVTIPKDLAGAIIGKGGARIRKIRQDSGAGITIDLPLPGSNDRIITINGLPNQIQMAQFLLQQSVHENADHPY